MLETGVNVPEAANLVFMRPVHSRINAGAISAGAPAAMLPANTRSGYPMVTSGNFLIIDFWENDFSKRPGEQVAQGLRYW